jgi:hypothetical protein
MKVGDDTEEVAVLDVDAALAWGSTLLLFQLR